MPPRKLSIQPFFISFFTERSRIISSSPSSIPVRRARSDFRSYAFNFSTISTGRFFNAACGSSEKNSLPSTNIFFTSFPWIISLPSAVISPPGNCFTSSSSIEPSGVRKAEELYTVVSFSVTAIGALPVITVSSSINPSGARHMSPIFLSL